MPVYIGYIDETHYVSTVDTLATEFHCDRKPDHKLGSGNITTKSVNRKTFLREYMIKRKVVISKTSIQTNNSEGKLIN